MAVAAAVVDARVGAAMAAVAVGAAIVATRGMRLLEAAVAVVATEAALAVVNPLPALVPIPVRVPAQVLARLSLAHQARKARALNRDATVGRLSRVVCLPSAELTSDRLTS